MNQPQSNTILNGPTGELTMAFKEAQKAPINNPNTPNNQVSKEKRRKFINILTEESSI